MKKRRYEHGVLVNLVHIEYIVGGRKDHLVAVRQDDRLQHIDGLRDGSHLHPAAMVVEDIQIDAGDECIAERILLKQKGRICSLLNGIPGPPFVNDKPYTLAGIVEIHNGGMSVDKFFHPQRLLHGAVPVLFGHVGRVNIVAPRVVMQRETPDRISHLAHHDIRPIVVVITRSDGYFFDTVLAVVLQKTSITQGEV